MLAVTHGPLVQPELFGDVVADAGHELLAWDIRTQGTPPLEGYDAVLVFGGEQNVGEEVEYPWLHEEYEALRRWVEDSDAAARRLSRRTDARACARRRRRPRAARAARRLLRDRADSGGQG